MANFGDGLVDFVTNLLCHHKFANLCPQHNLMTFQGIYPEIPGATCLKAG